MKYIFLLASFLSISSFNISAGEIFFIQKDTLNVTDARGFKQGKWIGKYENGKKRYEGIFKDNIPTGTFIYFYESGEKNAELTFWGDGKKSKAKYFHLNGKLKAQGNYVEQKKDSVWKYFDDREILSEEEIYSRGIREGISKIYYLDGSIAEVKNWKNNVENGPVKQFFQGGKLKYEANYRDGNPEGEVSFYHPNGQVKSTGLYQFAVKNGDWINYNEDGSVNTIETYNKGVLVNLVKKNGKFTTQYPNGSLMEEITYKDGQKNGPFIIYFEQKTENREPKDTSAKAMEEWQTLYSDVKIFEEQNVTEPPKVKMQGNYVNDKFDGEIIHYDISGAIEKKEFYKDGQLIKKK